MEKVLEPGFITNEPEPFIDEESCDRSGRHTVSSDSKSLGTSQKLPHPQIPVVSDNEARGAWPAPGDAGTEFCGESKHEFSGKSRCDARSRRHECVRMEILSKWR